MEGVYRGDAESPIAATGQRLCTGKSEEASGSRFCSLFGED